MRYSKKIGVALLKFLGIPTAFLVLLYSAFILLLFFLTKTGLLFYLLNLSMQLFGEKISLEAFEAESGIALPEGAYIVKYDDATRNDPEYMGYTWIFFSTNSISLPERVRCINYNEYKFDSNDEKEYFTTLNGLINKTNIKEAFNINFDKSKFIYDGILVRTTKGDYLKINRLYNFNI
ncbi:MAG: hypothetical protein PHO36_15985 [Parabacteroides sp.]|nr:hypothetical protein [Parabacteroides sp.]